ncbi:expressed unknown protein [Seminavis robusta]|uniref:Uncharacterized protein n=1 Tax=Seminavis robusta TaxID=568900 RepID=A0A9N8EPD5_9STRA|nr:expressed unknown protein [Seminavis robusta]|eukprot:Sro1284_g259230.1 n/a (317) ;mRNA; r:20901-22109
MMYSSSPLPLFLLLLSSQVYAFSVLPLDRQPPSPSSTRTKFARHSWMILSSAVADGDSAVVRDDDNSKAKKNNNIQSPPSSSLSMPWSDFHHYALHDNLPKYIRILPGETPHTCALWRTMLQDVPELSGYPIEFLQQRYGMAPPTQQEEESTDNKPSQSKKQAPEMLPFLDNFYFEPSGGLSGQVYGVPGLKDGTRIETSSVGQVEVTIPLGYVLTQEAGVAYELGNPLPTTESTSNEAFTDGMARTASSLTQQASDAVVQNSANLLATTTKTAATMDDEDSAFLVKLGATTGIVLAGATAVSMLSHHLTVNVFWV